MPSGPKTKYSQPYNAFPKWAWAVTFLALWQILLRAQNPGLMADDSGEMIAASVRLGIAHPPGYPLFCLLGRLFSLLPIGQPAFRFNLLSALFGISSLALLLDVFLRFQGRKEWVAKFPEKGFIPFLPLISIFFFFTNRDFFSQCLTAKGAVYTLTLLFLSGLINLFVRDHLGLSPRYLSLLLFFLGGLGLSHHWQTQVLWLPFLGYWLFHRGEAWPLKKILLALTVALLGLSPYLYLPLRGSLGVQPSWGAPQVWQGFRWVVSRGPFTGLEPAFRNGEVYLQFLGEYFRILWADWAPGFCLLALFGLWVLWNKSKMVFYATLLLYLPMLFGILTVPRPETLFLIKVYLVPANALFVFWGLAGLWGLAEILKRFAIPRKITFAAIAAISLVSVFGVFRIEDKSRYLVMGDFGVNVLKCLPQGALLLAEGDHYVMPIFYQHSVLNLRSDLIFLPAPFLLHSWGWEQLGNLSADLKPLILESNLFQGRLDALTRVSDSHPLCYSLGREYLAPALDKMPGFWAPRGLVYTWEPRRISSRVEKESALRAVAYERWRGVLKECSSPSLDISTRQICRYYDWQLAVLK